MLHDIDNGKNHYYFEYSEVEKEFGIPKSSGYKMISNPDNTMKKWNKYKLYSVDKPLFETTRINYE
jgi:hypothetical protein